MTRHQARFLRHLLLAGDVVLSTVAFAFAVELRQWLGTTELGARLGSLAAVENYGMLMFGMLPLWALSFHVTGSSDVRCGLSRVANRHLRAVGLGLLMLIGAGFLLRLQFLSRGFVLLLGASQLGLLLASRAVVHGVLRWRGPDVDHRVLVVGCDRAAVRFAEALRRQAWSQRLVGFVALPDKPRLAAATPVVAEIEALAELLDREPIDEVVFTVSERSEPAVREAIDACQIRGVDVLMALPAALPRHGRVELAERSGLALPMLCVSPRALDHGRLAAKRLLDLFGASVLLMLTTPAWLAALVAVRLEGRGPALVRRVRAGRYGRQFLMLELRTTTPDAGSDGLDTGLDTRSAATTVTRVGALLRAARLDVLPQLLNVLMGHMSLVGPRPPLPTEVAHYEPWQRRRLSVRPGLTGLWQLGEVDTSDGDQHMKLDLRYIDTWSLRLDLEILARTVPAMLSRRAAR